MSDAIEYVFKPGSGTKPTNPKDACGVLKVPMSYVSAPVLAELAVAMAEGGHKYGRHNYRVIGVRASIYYDALMRHAMLWWEGEDIDPDSGANHITKAIATLVVLRDAMMAGNWVDDRPPRSKKGWMDPLNETTKQLLVKYPQPVASYTEKGRWKDWPAAAEPSWVEGPAEVEYPCDVEPPPDRDSGDETKVT